MFFNIQYCALRSALRLQCERQSPSCHFLAFGYNDFIIGINLTTDDGYDFNQQLDNVAGYDLVYIEY